MGESQTGHWACPVVSPGPVGRAHPPPGSFRSRLGGGPQPSATLGTGTKCPHSPVLGAARPSLRPWAVGSRTLSEVGVGGSHVSRVPQGYRRVLGEAASPLDTPPRSPTPPPTPPPWGVPQTRPEAPILTQVEPRDLARLPSRPSPVPTLLPPLRCHLLSLFTSLNSTGASGTPRLAQPTPGAPVSSAWAPTWPSRAGRCGLALLQPTWVPASHAPAPEPRLPTAPGPAALSARLHFTNLGLSFLLWLPDQVAPEAASALSPSPAPALWPPGHAPAPRWGSAFSSANESLGSASPCLGYGMQVPAIPGDLRQHALAFPLALDPRPQTPSRATYQARPGAAGARGG